MKSGDQISSQLEGWLVLVQNWTSGAQQKEKLQVSQGINGSFILDTFQLLFLNSSNLLPYLPQS